MALLVQRIRNGRLGERFKEILLSCILVAVPKRDGTARPVAIGESFYKMAAFLALDSVRGVIPQVLGADQFAFLPGGSETASLMLKALLEENTGVATDLVNAYNSLGRDKMLEALYAEPRLEPIFRLVDWAYSSPTNLYVRGADNIVETIPSANGTRQGDPFGMLLFCLGVVGPIKAGLAVGGDGVSAVAVADDVTFIGPPDGEAASIATAAFIQACHPLSLRFRGDKSKILNFSGAPLHATTTAFAVANRIPILTDATMILGTPMGSDAAAVQALAVEEIAGSATLLDSLAHPEMPLSVAEKFLRSATMPKLNYLSRVGLPGEYSDALQSFDSRVTLTQEGLWGMDLSSGIP